MRQWVLLFIFLSALEIGVFMLAGKWMGIMPTVLLIIVTGMVGVYLTKKQGVNVLYQLQSQIQNRQPPGIAMLDGVCVLIGGILLICPGFITDLLGLLLLIPFTRKFIRPSMIKMIKNWVNRKQLYIYR
ncbi:FxsA family protein [Bacillus sp. SD088]|uniref:FxsA family protein n=1 Tax=Bacillus sp. SD088 TaxID=2782012 RepID=UPI001A95E34D|nr:FxsA family protein [Bacillus sp. SD088]MBO0992319.1 membrane protein FxsA [Bacillus sp. SD088]